MSNNSKIRWSKQFEILAHRGFPNRDNSIDGLVSALSRGWGIETDVRDHLGEIVISHDPIVKATQVMHLEELLYVYHLNAWEGTLALNIKSDGLAPKLAQIISQYEIKNYFFFDMSVPDHMTYLEKLTNFVRISEFEANNELAKLSSGCWLDELKTPWVGEQELKEILATNKRVGIVSRELHGWNHEPQWRIIKKLMEENRWLCPIMLCTDFPDQAEEYFYGKH